MPNAESRPLLARLLLAAALGGVLGSLARYGATAGTDALAASSAWAVAGINILGSTLGGYLLGRYAAGWSAVVRAGVFAGVLGGFTTFSAVTVEAMSAASDAGAPMEAPRVLMGFALAAGMTVVPVLCAIAGLVMGGAGGRQADAP